MLGLNRRLKGQDAPIVDVQPLGRNLIAQCHLIVLRYYSQGELTTGGKEVAEKRRGGFP